MSLVNIFYKIDGAITAPHCIKLTSRDSRQYQQNTCLQRRHIIWAQPSLRSMGIWHNGHRFIIASSSGLKKILEIKNIYCSYWSTPHWQYAMTFLFQVSPIAFYNSSEMVIHCIGAMPLNYCSCIYSPLWGVTVLITAPHCVLYFHMS